MIDVLKEVEEIKEKKIPIIVEGKRDRKSLEKFGIKNIFEINKGLFEVIEEIESFDFEGELVILTDFDKEGLDLYKKLKIICERKGIKVNDRLRNILYKSELSHIEGFDTWFNKFL